MENGLLEDHVPYQQGLNSTFLRGRFFKFVLHGSNLIRVLPVETMSDPGLVDLRQLSGGELADQQSRI